MRSAGVAFIVSLAVAAVLTPAVRLFALRHGLLDHAVGSRKIHGKPIPRLGGIAIVAAFYAPLAGLLLYTTGMSQLIFADRFLAAGLLGGGLIIAALGLLDDLRGTGAVLKFTVQFSVALVLYELGFRIDHVATPWGGPVPLGVLALPLTLVWIVGVVNAMNLVDGLDGLAGGVALFALASTFAIAFFRGEAIMALFAAALAGSVAGFLFYNWNPASIFMGDTGSMFLGFVLAAGSIWTNQKSSTAVAILVPIVALGLPIADTLLALLRRALRGRPLFSADKEHIHHRLLALGLSQRQAVILLYGACIVLGVSALILSWANSAQTASVLCILSVVGFFAVRRLGLLRGAPIHERRKNLEVRALVRGIDARLREAETPSQVWEAVRPFGEAVLAARISLAISSTRESGDRVTTLYEHGGPAPGRALFERPFEIGDDAGRLVLGWDDGRAEIDRDAEIAAEVLCNHLADAIEQITPAPAVPAAPPTNLVALARRKQ